MSVLTGWRAALRIARRDALRAKGRSALVLSMIALPVLGVTAADVTYRSSSPTVAEDLTARMGSADAVFSSAGIGAVPLEQMPDAGTWGTPDGAPEIPGEDERRPVNVPATFPKGARYLSEQSVPAVVTTRHGVVNTEIVELRTSDPAVRGKLGLVDGAYPHGEGEVVATEHFLESAGLGVGSRTTLSGPGRTYTITGSVELPGDLDKSALYADPGAVIAPWKAAAGRDEKIVPPYPGDMTWLVRSPTGAGISWPDVLRANEKGVLVLSRQVALDPPPDSEVPLLAHEAMSFTESSAELSAAVVTVVAMAVLEIVLLAGPAFAVGARRSRRQLGLVGTCGGDRSQVRAVVLAGGLVLGAVGAVTGVAAGIGLTVLFRPMIEGWTGSRFGELDIRPWELLGIAVIGLVTGVLAALAPAVVAGRQSVLESLTGRRGTRRSSRVLPLVGGVALTGGVAVAVYGGTTGDTRFVAGGSVVAELGVLACIPVIVGLLGRLGTRLPLSPAWRCATRPATEGVRHRRSRPSWPRWRAPSPSPRTPPASRRNTTTTACAPSPRARWRSWPPSLPPPTSFPSPGPPRNGISRSPAVAPTSGASGPDPTAPSTTRTRTAAAPSNWSSRPARATAVPSRERVPGSSPRASPPRNTRS